MPKKKTPALKPKDQFKRFVETANELGVDDSGRELENAFAKVARNKKSLPTPSSPRSKP